jgi:long-chain acyl-CoA synthetase
MASNISTIAELVRFNASEYGDIPFLFFYDETISYKILDQRSDAFAAYLSENSIKKGDIVSFMLGNTPAFFDTLLGAQKIGAVAGPISCWWQATEVAFLVNDSKPKVLVMDPEYAHLVSQIKDRIDSVERIIINAPAPMDLDFSCEYLPEILKNYRGKVAPQVALEKGDTASIMYTSGTTGKPKGVMLSHHGIIHGARIKTEQVPIEKTERILCVLPLFHSGGLNDLAFPSMYRAASIVLRRNFSASEFWECVEQFKVNGFYIVPTMWNILLKSPEADTVDTSSLRIGLSGAAPIPPEQLIECEERFHLPIIEAYGATENTGGITANTEVNRKFGSIGTALPDIEVDIFDDDGNTMAPGEIGEIVVKGDTVMKGYYNNPTATDESIRDGWFYTGDVGYKDKDSFYFIVDRKKDMIIRGGVNVYPMEIESVIANHPRVDTAAVVSEPHDIYGQVAKACIVLKRGETCSADEIREFCQDKLAEYKIPEHFVFRASLPTNAVGKVVKKDLIKELEEEETAEPVPVAYLFEGMAQRFLADKAQGVDATLSYHITGKGGGVWTVTIEDGKMTLTREILKSPRVYIVAGDRNYHDIATGKLDGLTAVLTGKMTIEGDLNFMAEFREMFTPLKNEQ